MKLHAAILLMLGMLPWAGLHATETGTTTLRVSARVVEFCDVTTTDLAPDTYTAQDGTPLLRATCTPSATYFVGLTKGASRGVSGIAAGALTVGVGTGEPVDHTLFGGIPAAQDVAPVDYNDTVAVRVYY